MRFQLPMFALLVLATVPQLCVAQEAIEPVVPLTQPQVQAHQRLVFPVQSGERFMPLVIHSAEEAEGRFTDDFMTKLTEEVDWDQQVVLVFAWVGSGSDQFSYEVSEGMPSQTTFRYRMGRTLDIAYFNQIYALRNDVEWEYQVLDP